MFKEGGGETRNRTGDTRIFAERDLEIFTYMARLRMLTMNQMAALFHNGHPLPNNPTASSSTSSRGSSLELR